MLLLVALVAASALARIEKQGELRWAGDLQGGEPYVYRDPVDPRRLDGFEVEIAAGIARRLGVRATFVQNDWSNLLPSLARGDFDVALNGIGASVFPAFLNSLAAGGRMVIYSAAFGGREAPVDLFAFYRKRQQLLGLDTVAIDAVQAAKILSQLAPLFESGELTKPLIAERYPLADAAQAYERVASARGKTVLQIAD